MSVLVELQQQYLLLYIRIACNTAEIGQKFSNFHEQHIQHTAVVCLQEHYIAAVVRTQDKTYTYMRTEHTSSSSPVSYNAQCTMRTGMKRYGNETITEVLMRRRSHHNVPSPLLLQVRLTTTPSQYHVNYYQPSFIISGRGTVYYYRHLVLLYRCAPVSGSTRSYGRRNLLSMTISLQLMPRNPQAVPWNSCKIQNTNPMIFIRVVDPSHSHSRSRSHSDGNENDEVCFTSTRELS